MLTFVTNKKISGKPPKNCYVISVCYIIMFVCYSKLYLRWNNQDTENILLQTAFCLRQSLLYDRVKLFCRALKYFCVRQSLLYLSVLNVYLCFTHALLVIYYNFFSSLIFNLLLLGRFQVKNVSIIFIVLLKYFLKCSFVLYFL